VPPIGGTQNNKRLDHMRLRILGHYLYVPLLLLGVVEAAALLLSYCLAFRFVSDDAQDLAALRAQAALFTSCTTLSMVTMGLFCQRLRDRFSGILLRVGLSLVLGGLLARLLSLVFLDQWITRLVLAVAVSGAWLLVLLTRLLMQSLMNGEYFKRRVLVLGAGRRAARILRLRRRADQRGFRLVGFAAMEGDEAVIAADRLVALEEQPLIQYARANDIREIVVALDDRRRNFPFRQLLECRLAGIEVIELPDFLERETGKVFLDCVGPSWLIFGGGFRRGWLRQMFERGFDLLVSGVMVVLGLPFMLTVAVAIKLEDGWGAPVFYAQERVGQYGRVFKVLKFRSMRIDAERDGKASWAQKNDTRVTRVGAVIRKTRLDELPQLLNVFAGSMSFVGPRPERPMFVARLGEEIPFYDGRHSVKPGITGWAQLCYPYGASDQDALEKLQYDLFYVKNHGLVFDFMILLQTVEVILFGKGAR
jgi:sugar transferase (PEP-CTERM system associated)